MPAVHRRASRPASKRPHRNSHLSAVRFLVAQLVQTMSLPYRVFASRIGTSEPKWNYKQARYVWHRFALATVPRLAEPRDRIRIPWPSFPQRRYPEGIFVCSLNSGAILTIACSWTVRYHEGCSHQNYLPITSIRLAFGATPSSTRRD